MRPFILPSGKGKGGETERAFWDPLDAIGVAWESPIVLSDYSSVFLHSVGRTTLHGRHKCSVTSSFGCSRWNNALLRCSLTPGSCYQHILRIMSNGFYTGENSN